MFNVFFAGTPTFTLPVLKVLMDKTNLVAVLTASPKRQGRAMKKQNSAVFDFIEKLKDEGKLGEDVPVYTPEKLDDNFLNSCANLKCDLLISFACGHIFPMSFVSLFRMGGINIHPSLLPKWRGAAPIPSAIYNGDFVTGVSVQTIKAKMDAGDILIQEPFTIEENENACDVLQGKVANIAASLVEKLLDDFEVYLKNATCQDEKEATYSRKLRKEDALIDWTRSALEISWQVRAYHSWPGTCTFCNGKKLNIIAAHEYKKHDISNFYKENVGSFGKVIGLDASEGILVQTGSGILCITELQWETKKALKWKDFSNGCPALLTYAFSQSKND